MPPAVADRKEVARHLYEEVLNTRLLDERNDLYRPSYDTDLQAIRDFHTALIAAIPDLRFTVRDVIGEDDKVAVRWIARGTHQGSFAGVPATRARVTLTGIDLFRIEDGKIAEHWSEMDQFGLLARIQSASDTAHGG